MLLKLNTIFQDTISLLAQFANLIEAHLHDLIETGAQNIEPKYGISGKCCARDY